VVVPRAGGGRIGRRSEAPAAGRRARARRSIVGDGRMAAVCGGGRDCGSSPIFRAPLERRFSKHRNRKNVGLECHTISNSLKDES
jgi:hypothetical protein